MPAKEPPATARQPSRQQRIYALVRRVPEGQVASYGQLARLVGCGARLVGYAMAALPARGEVPWHRVINADGGISPRRRGGGEIRQRRLLEAEGVRFDSRGRVDLETVGWHGPGWDWLERHGYDPGAL